jgi:hypothetical protein
MMAMSNVRNRRGLFLLGKTRQIKQAESGAYSFPRRRIGPTSIKCGFIP